MKSIYLLTACAVPLGGAIAWQLDQATGAGVLVGSGVATAIGLAGLAWQDRLLRTRPSWALNAAGIGFLAKLLALLAGALALRFLPAAGARVDWTGYLLGFAGAVLWVTAVGSLRHLRALRTTTKEHGA